MTVEELTNIFLRLDMAGKAEDSEFLFGSRGDGVDPFSITGVFLDEDGDVCLESDDREGESTLFNIKDGGTKDRYSESLRIITTYCGAYPE